MPRPPRLSPDAVAAALTARPLWSGGPAGIERTVELPSFRSAVEAISVVADIAEQLDHHPDMDLRWTRVRVAVVTHSAGGLTELDLSFADRVDLLFPCPAAAPRGSVGDPRHTAGMRPVQIVFDAVDPERLGTFWAGALADRGYRLPEPPDGAPDWPTWLAAQGVPEEDWGSAFALESDESQPRIFLQRVPEPKTAKNRVHIDLLAGGGPRVPLAQQQEGVRAAVERLTALGATFVEEKTELGVHWAVLRDPEGNEFCA